MKFVILFGFLSAFVLAGCGGGTVTSGSGGYHVNVRASGLSLEYSTSVLLENNEIDQLEITADGTHAFSRALGNEDAYRVTILEEPSLQNCRLSDAEGQIQGADVIVALFCDDRTWSHHNGETFQLSQEGPEAQAFDLAMDANGNAAVVWQQVQGDDWRVFKSEYRNKTWIHPSDFDDALSLTSSQALVPAVALNGQGQGLIVWGQQDTNLAVQIMKCELAADVWTCPTGLDDNMSPDGTHARIPLVTLSETGDAVVSWTQDSTAELNAPSHIFVSEKRNGTWSYPTGMNDHINFDGAGSYALRQASNALGDTVLLWQQGLGTRQGDLYARIFWEQTWQGPSGSSDYFSFPYNLSTIDPFVAINNGGVIAVTWAQYIGTGYRVYARMFQEGAWLPLGSIADSLSLPGLAGASSPTVAINDRGEALALFTQRETTMGPGSIFLATYAEGEWTRPTDVYDTFNPGVGDAFAPKVVMDQEGNAIAAWLETTTEGKVHLFLRERRLGVWFPHEDVTASVPNDDVWDFDLAISEAGNALVVWRQVDEDGTNRLFASEFK